MRPPMKKILSIITKSKLPLKPRPPQLTDSGRNPSVESALPTPLSADLRISQQYKKSTVAMYRESSYGLSHSIEKDVLELLFKYWPIPETPIRIFISHAWKDNPEVGPIIHGLAHLLGERVEIISDDNLSAGTHLDHDLMNKLETSRFVITILSDAYISQCLVDGNNGVKQEIVDIKKAYDDRYPCGRPENVNSTQPQIIPIVLEGTDFGQVFTALPFLKSTLGTVTDSGNRFKNANVMIEVIRTMAQKLKIEHLPDLLGALTKKPQHVLNRMVMFLKKAEPKRFVSDAAEMSYPEAAECLQAKSLLILTALNSADADEIYESLQLAAQTDILLSNLLPPEIALFERVNNGVNNVLAAILQNHHQAVLQKASTAVIKRHNTDELKDILTTISTENTKRAIENYIKRVVEEEDLTKKEELILSLLYVVDLKMDASLVSYTYALIWENKAALNYKDFGSDFQDKCKFDFLYQDYLWELPSEGKLEETEQFKTTQILLSLLENTPLAIVDKKALMHRLDTFFKGRNIELLKLPHPAVNNMGSKPASFYKAIMLYALYAEAGGEKNIETVLAENISFQETVNSVHLMETLHGNQVKNTAFYSLRMLKESPLNPLRLRKEGVMFENLGFHLMLQELIPGDFSMDAQPAVESCRRKSMVADPEENITHHITRTLSGSIKKMDIATPKITYLITKKDSCFEVEIEGGKKIELNPYIDISYRIESLSFPKNYFYDETNDTLYICCADGSLYAISFLSTNPILFVFDEYRQLQDSISIEEEPELFKTHSLFPFAIDNGFIKVDLGNNEMLWLKPSTRTAPQAGKIHRCEKQFKQSESGDGQAPVIIEYLDDGQIIYHCGNISLPINFNTDAIIETNSERFTVEEVEGYTIVHSYSDEKTECYVFNQNSELEICFSYDLDLKFVSNIWMEADDFSVEKISESNWRLSTINCTFEIQKFKSENAPCKWKVEGAVLNELIFSPLELAGETGYYSDDLDPYLEICPKTEGEMLASGVSPVKASLHRQESSVSSLEQFDPNLVKESHIGTFTITNGRATPRSITPTNGVARPYSRQQRHSQSTLPSFTEAAEEVAGASNA